MKPKLVISGSAKLQDEVARWLDYWKSKGYEVLDYPKKIAEADFQKVYKDERTTFFDNIRSANVLFVMNEDKNGTGGYIGPSTFAEIAFAITENHLSGNSIEVVLLKTPADTSVFFEDVSRWKDLGWISIHPTGE